MKRSPLQELLAERLEHLDRGGLRRYRAPATRDAASFASNDYLGLATSEASALGATGSGASRLVGGDAPEHLALENELRSWLALPAALTFTSGYAANVGVVSALAGPDDVVVSDALNHASLIDGARLSRARVEVVPHLDLDATDRALRAPRRGHAFVVAESYYSMDADSPDLARLRALCDAYQATLVVDEAHALGVFGPEGGGLCAAAQVRPDVLIGTFGKALGTGGAFVGGAPELVDWLWNRARSFVFSTGLSPALAAATTRAIRRVRTEPELRARVSASAARLREQLRSAGLRPTGYGHVVPCIVGEAAMAVSMSARLAEHGVYVPPIRPPSVPQGTARLRFTATGGLGEADFARLARALTRFT